MRGNSGCSGQIYKGGMVIRPIRRVASDAFSEQHIINTVNER